MPSLSLFRCWAKELHFLRRRSIIAQVFILLDNPLIEYTHTKGALTKSAIIFVKAPFWLVERLIIFVDKMGKGGADIFLDHSGSTYIIPKLSLYSTGLMPPKVILIRSSLYQ